MIKAYKKILDNLLLSLVIICGFEFCSSDIAKHHRQKHLREIKYNNNNYLLVDIVPNNSIIKSQVANIEDTFFCFKIGLEDSTNYDAQKKIDRQKYIDYTLEKDWTALVNSDSVKPVFFQTLPNKTSFLFEGILVFEIKKADKIDTLIYRDSYITKESKIIVLNRK